MQKCSRKIKAGHEKSRVGYFSFIIFILETTSMYFQLTYYCYYNINLFFSPAVLKMFCGSQLQQRWQFWNENQGLHRNIHCNTALFHIHVHWFIFLGCNTNYFQISQERFCWFIPSVTIFYTFSFITHSK